MGFFDFMTEDIAIDLGTANTLIIHNDKVVIDSPSIVASDRISGKIIAVGKEANMMQGKTHENIKTIGKRCIRIRLHKHERRRQFDRGGRETRHKARKDAACHQRQHDAPHGPRFGGAEIFRRFLERNRNLLQRRTAGA